jgi:hypothetical protein
MSDIDKLTPARLQALREQVEAEKSKRTQERVAAGECFVVSPGVIFRGCGEVTAEQIEKERAQALQDHLARNPWDRGKVPIFDDGDSITIVFTGVPRAGDGCAWPEFCPLNPPLKLPEEPKPEAKLEGADAALPVEPEFKQIQTQLTPAENGPGAVAIGWYSVNRDVLTVRHEDGVEETAPLLPGEDPVRTAKKMLRDRADIGDQIMVPRFDNRCQ